MRHIALALAALAGFVAIPGSACAEPLHTRLGDPGFVSPNASIAQMHWLIGQWSGEGIGGAAAHESWLPPSGTTMVGTFVQETADGAIRFTEHLYLMEQDGSLTLKLKHFNADLTGWEERNDTTDFRLLAIEDCAAFFHSLTLRCDGTNGLLAAVRMKGGGELVFRLRRIGQSVAAPRPGTPAS